MDDVFGHLDDDVQALSGWLGQTGAVAEAVNGVPAPIRRRSTKAGTKVGQSSVADEGGAVQPRRHKGRYTIAQKFAARTTGKVCTCCGRGDDPPDPITPAKHILWAMYIDENKGKCVDILLVTEGATCWYCYRVWNVRYMTEMNLSTLKQRKGSEHSLHEQFDSYFHWLVQTLSQQYEAEGDRESMHTLVWSPKSCLSLTTNTWRREGTRGQMAWATHFSQALEVCKWSKLGRQAFGRKR